MKPNSSTIVAIAGGLVAAVALGVIVAAATSEQGPLSQDETTVTAPGARVDTSEEGTRVEAPFTTVEKGQDKVRVRAPFVDIEVPKTRDEPKSPDGK